MQFTINLLQSVPHPLIKCNLLSPHTEKGNNSRDNVRIFLACFSLTATSCVLMALLMLMTWGGERRERERDERNAEDESQKAKTGRLHNQSSSAQPKRQDILLPRTPEQPPVVQPRASCGGSRWCRYSAAATPTTPLPSRPQRSQKKRAFPLCFCSNKLSRTSQDVCPCKQMHPPGAVIHNDSLI